MSKTVKELLNNGIIANGGLKIKSTVLVDIINQFRALENGKAELRHDDFMKKIKNEIKTLKSLGLNSLGNFSESDYINSLIIAFMCDKPTERIQNKLDGKSIKGI